MVCSAGLKSDGSTKHLCRSQGYTARWQRKVYFTFLTSYILLIPFLIMSFCYLNIIRVVWKRVEEPHQGAPKLMIRFRSFRSSAHHSNATVTTTTSELCGSGDAATGSDLDSLPQRCFQGRACATSSHSKIGIPKKLISSSKRNVVKMTLSVIIAFLICWSPYFILSLIRIYSNYRIKLKEGLMVAEIMALVHSALNPILYGIFSTKYTKTFFRRVRRKLCCCCPGQGVKFDDAVSEADDSWRESTRYTIASVQRPGELAGSERDAKPCAPSRFCGHFLDTMTCGLWGFLWAKSFRTSNQSKAFYQELVPNGHHQFRRTNSRTTDSGHSGRNHIEMDSDVESNLQGLRSEQASSRGVRDRRSTVSLVFTNPDPATRRADYISAV